MAFANPVWPQVVYTRDRLLSLQSQKERMIFLYGPNSQPFKAFSEKLEKAHAEHSNALKLVA